VTTGGRWPRAGRVGAGQPSPSSKPARPDKAAAIATSAKDVRCCSRQLVFGRHVGVLSSLPTARMGFLGSAAVHSFRATRRAMSSTSTAVSPAGRCSCTAGRLGAHRVVDHPGVSHPAP
jgi:hypothetical protein